MKSPIPPSGSQAPAVALGAAAGVPGTWSARFMESSHEWVVSNASSKPIAWVDRITPPDAGAANAALIAASPDLLSALVALKDRIADQMTFTNDGAGWQPDDLPLAQLMTAAEEAITKATAR